MSGWDKGSIFHADVLDPETNFDTDLQLERLCIRFLSEFRIHNEFVYREQIRRNVNSFNLFVVINLEHISVFDDFLLTQLLRRPHMIIQMVLFYLILARNSFQGLGSKHVFYSGARYC